MTCYTRTNRSRERVLESKNSLTRFLDFDIPCFLKTLRRKCASIAKARWAAYATAGAATALGSATSIEAEIHYSGILNVEFNDQCRDETMSFELTDPAKLIFRRGTSYCAYFDDSAGVVSAVSNAIRATYPSASLPFIERLEFGQNISSGRFYRGQRLGKMVLRYGTGQFEEPGQGFIGFKFDVGNGKQYGWARVRMAGGPYINRFILKDFAYADPAESITAGQTSSAGDTVESAPDSSSLGFLALGGAGLGAWRKRPAQRTQ